MHDIAEVIVRIAGWRQTDRYNPDDGAVRSDDEGRLIAKQASAAMSDADVTYKDGVFILTYKQPSVKAPPLQVHAGTQRLFRRA